MDELKALFGEGTLTYAEFEQKCTEGGIKLANLATGGYVSKEKHERLQKDFDKFKAENDTSKYSDYDTIKSELETLKAQNAERELLEKISTAKVDGKFSKFVLSEVKGLVTDKKDFDACLTEYLQSNPQFVEQAQPQGNRGFFTSSSVNLDGKSTGAKTTDEKMNNFLKGVIK